MQEAFASALTTWPQRGMPSNPAAWITTAAQRKIIDQVRRQQTRTEKEDALVYETKTSTEQESIDDPMPEYPDDRLRLIFTLLPSGIESTGAGGAHSSHARWIDHARDRASFPHSGANACATPRASESDNREARIPYEVPPLQKLAERLDSVQAVIYLIFNEGYSATRVKA